MVAQRHCDCRRRSIQASPLPYLFRFALEFLVATQEFFTTTPVMSGCGSRVPLSPEMIVGKRGRMSAGLCRAGELSRILPLLFCVPVRRPYRDHLVRTWALWELTGLKAARSPRGD